MKKKVNELELHQIDYFVAKAEKIRLYFDSDNKRCLFLNEDYSLHCMYSPTTNPSQAWPIIEREKISIKPSSRFKDEWFAEIITNLFSGQHGMSSLEAAMRCYVAIKFGEEVDINV